LSLFVDTSVWSLAFRRDASAVASERNELVRAIEAGEELVITFLDLQGFSVLGPARRSPIASLRCRFWFPTGATMWRPPS
jgi:hypothetical protein